MFDEGYLNGLKISADDEFGVKCEHCIPGKGHRQPFPQKSTNRSSQLLELVHSDVNGHLETTIARKIPILHHFH